MPRLTLNFSTLSVQKLCHHLFLVDAGASMSYRHTLHFSLLKMRKIILSTSITLEKVAITTQISNLVRATRFRNNLH